jgi:hypothetical protein
MIRNQTEYREAVARVLKERQRFTEYELRLRKEGLAPDEVARALEPLQSFHIQLQEEVESYERLKRGDFGELQNLHGLGQTLIALRIFLGLTQRQLAKRLGVHESQVSRDERNEYHGITVERATQILDTLKVRLNSRLEQPLPTQTRSKAVLSERPAV